MNMIVSPIFNNTPISYMYYGIGHFQSIKTDVLVRRFRKFPNHISIIESATLMSIKYIANS